MDDKETVTGQSDYVLVPRVPTKEMLDAAWADALGEDALGVWRSMVKAYESRAREEEILTVEAAGYHASGTVKIDP